MSTYVISDIHGQLDALKDLLSLVSFKYNEDTLYLLGDYVDWGPKSIETIQYVMEMSSKYENIHPLLGNHDLMMYNVITNISDGTTLDEAWEIAYNTEYGCWLNNCGDETLSKFMRIDSHSRAEIRKWLTTLPYYKITDEISGKIYYLCHSKPFVNGMSLTDVVWGRIKDDRLPRSFIDRADKAILVSGHTIVNNYRSFDENMRLKIYKSPNNRYINIDCGAKLLGIRKMCRLAAIRLDDLEEFYIDGDM